MWSFLTGLFWVLFWLLVVLGFVAFKSYNKLQSHAQVTRERSSNIQVAISKKISLINRLMDVVKSFQEGEQFVHLKISQDSTATGLSSTYQQSGAILTSLQSAADRFPNLKSSEQYHRLLDSIQGCEADIQGQREHYNVSVREYNTVRLSIPAVFVAGFLGFSTASYLEFDVSGVAESGNLKSFKTDDGERLQQLLSSAGGHIAGASRVLVNQATHASRLAIETLREQRQATPDYFYQFDGGVPAGPAKLQFLIEQVQSGNLPGTLQVALVGSSAWQAISNLMPEDIATTTVTQGGQS